MFDHLVFDARTPPQKIVSAIQADGVALLRNAVPSAPLAALKEAVIALLSQLDAAVERHQSNEKVRDFALAHGLAGPYLESEVNSLLGMLAEGPIYQCAAQYFGDTDLSTYTNHLLFRRRDAETNKLFLKDCPMFHQDHGLIADHLDFNVWIPLSKIDDNTTGLSFVFPHEHKVASGLDKIDQYLRDTGSKVWTPELEVGDALLFHHYTIHGAYLNVEKPRPRFSVEFRVGKSSDVSDNEFKCGFPPASSELPPPLSQSPCPQAHP